MADGKGGGSDDLKTSFVFVRHGDPLPQEWMARHPGWVRLPATLVPRPVPRRVVPSGPWGAAGAGEPAGFGPASRPVSVGAPVVRRRKVPVHRLPTGGPRDAEDPIAAYLRISKAMDEAASTWLASVAGSSDTTKRVPQGHVAAAPDAHTLGIDGPYPGHTHHGDVLRSFGHSASISEATGSETFLDAAKPSSSLEITLSAPQQGDKLNVLPVLASLATGRAPAIRGWEKSASTNYQYVADDGRPGNNQAQNKEFEDAISGLGLTKKQRRLLHRDIQNDDLDYHGIRERAIEMFGE